MDLRTLVVGCLAYGGYGSRGSVLINASSQTTVSDANPHSEQIGSHALGSTLYEQAKQASRRGAPRVFSKKLNSMARLLLELNPDDCFCFSGSFAHSAKHSLGNAVGTVTRAGFRHPNLCSDRVTFPSVSRAAHLRMVDAGSERMEHAEVVDKTGTASGSKSPLVEFLIDKRPVLLVVAITLHKSLLDGLTRYISVAGSYSSSTVAFMCEVWKIPIIAAAIAAWGGGSKSIVPTFREAILSKELFSTSMWIGLCYTWNNLLYYGALGSLPVVMYQVLSQTQTVFTAGLMYILIGTKLSARKLVSIAMLIAGTILVRLQDAAKSGVVSKVATAAVSAPFGLSQVSWGTLLVLLGSLISAFPNVLYERMLKREKKNELATSLQITLWIMFWVCFQKQLVPILSGLFGRSIARPALPPVTELTQSLRQAFVGFTPAVWAVTVIQSLKGILIPATLKYADNILYSFSKPGSILITMILSCVMAGKLPSPTLFGGVSAVIASMLLYSSKPAPRKKSSDDGATKASN